MNPHWKETLERLTRKHGHLLSLHAMERMPHLFYLFHGPRVEVKTVYDNGTQWVRRGYVGCSSGHNPVFLLLPRCDSSGSSDVLHERDEIKIVPNPRYFTDR
jgi:hypothetical protein